MGFGRRLVYLALMLLACLSSATISFSQVEQLGDVSCDLQAPVGYLDDFWSAAISPWGDKTIPVIHLGDSHVQGGYFSMPIRAFFDRYFGLAGLGWVAPYSFLRSNQPYPSRFSRVGGAWSGSFITSRKYGDSMSPTGFSIEAIGKGMNELELRADGYLPLRRVVVFRDASTQPLTIKGATTANTSRLSMVEAPVADTLFLNWGSASGTISLIAPKGAKWYGVSLESQDSGVLLHTIGYNGAFFSSFNQPNFLGNISLLNPKLLIISLGTNDMLVSRFSKADFASNVRSLVMRLQRTLPDTPIVLTSPLPAFKTVGRNRRQLKWQECKEAEVVSIVLAEEAGRMGCGFIDLYAYFYGNNGAAALLEKGLLSKDRIHLTKEGYEAMGEAVAYALMEDFRNFLDRKKPFIIRW